LTWFEDVDEPGQGSTLRRPPGLGEIATARSRGATALAFAPSAVSGAPLVVRAEANLAGLEGACAVTGPRTT
jgi:hypothetical protein